MKTFICNIRIFAIILFVTGICKASLGQDAITKIDSKSLTIASLSDLKFTDIGSVSLAGSVSINNGEITMSAGGTDIWGKHDEFYFGYKIIQGDFDIRVQIIGLSAAHKYTKAGIMARTDLTDSCQHVFFQVFPDNSPRNKNNGGCEFQYRMEKGTEMKAIYPDPLTAGHKFDVNFPDTWIRLKRNGNVFDSFISNDNKTWRPYSTFNISLGEKLFVGLAVTSHNKAGYTTAIFKKPVLEKQP